MNYCLRMPISVFTLILAFLIGCKPKPMSEPRSEDTLLSGSAQHALCKFTLMVSYPLDLMKQMLEYSVFTQNERRVMTEKPGM
jgi:hypothetical protein